MPLIVEKNTNYNSDTEYGNGDNYESDSDSDSDSEYYEDSYLGKLTNEYLDYIYENFNRKYIDDYKIFSGDFPKPIYLHSNYKSKFKMEILPSMFLKKQNNGFTTTNQQSIQDEYSSKKEISMTTTDSDESDSDDDIDLTILAKNKNSNKKQLTIAPKKKNFIKEEKVVKINNHEFPLLSICPNDIQQNKSIKEEWITVKSKNKENNSKIERNKAFDILSNKEKIETKLNKTKMCLSILNNIVCPHGLKCRFAHYKNEIVVAACLFKDECRFVKMETGSFTNISKTKICKYLHPKETKDNYFKRIGFNDIKRI